MGDIGTPRFHKDGRIIADCTVTDEIYFAIPTKHPNKYNPFPPGRYEIQVIVPNDIRYDVKYKPMREFQSNKILLNIHPAPEIGYRLWNDWGHCYDDTEGWGADEIWIKAEIATFAPGKSKTFPLDIKEIPRYAWNDMDQDEDTRGPYTFEFFNGKLEPLRGLAISLIGFEVDSEKAAQERMDSWSECFELFMKNMWDLIGSKVGAGIGTVVAAGAMTPAGWAAAIAVVVSTVIGQNLRK